MIIFIIYKISLHRYENFYTYKNEKNDHQVSNINVKKCGQTIDRVGCLPNRCVSDEEPAWSRKQSMDRMMTGQYPSSDCGFILDMIYHHQIAVDMAEHIMKYTTNPFLMSLCRNIIWAQKYEIWTMRRMLRGFDYHSPLLAEKNSYIGIGLPSVSYYAPVMSTSQGLENEKCLMNQTNSINQSINWTAPTLIESKGIIK